MDTGNSNLQQTSIPGAFLLSSSPTVHPDEPIPTRQSLVLGIKDLHNDRRWTEFYQTYGGLLLGIARRAGLTEPEAQDSLQEVLLAVSEAIPRFSYDPAKDSFKGWLLQIARWKIADQFRKRSGEVSLPPDTIAAISDSTPGTDFEKLFDAEWNAFRLAQALSRVKRLVNPMHYTIYHLYVVQGKPIAEVKKALSVSAAAIYLAKHRVGAVLRKELGRAEE